ncbi:MAG: ACP S-malonyltransferase [Candidatus Aenigmatarchaeota archaeon]
MDKVVYVFPGQGSQHLGMARDIYKSRKFKHIRKIIDDASEIIGEDVIKLCTRRPPFLKGRREKMEAELSKSEKVQPAIFATSFALFKALETKSKNDWYAALGHSLGEYTALAATESLSFPEGVELVKKRAEYMRECSEGSGMAAIVRRDLNRSEVEEICSKTDCHIAIFNNCQQVVIGGPDKNLSDACEIAKEKGYMTFRIKMEGCPHTPIMKPAAEKLSEYIKRVNIRMAKRPIIANTSAKGIVDPDDIRSELVEHMYKPLLFSDCVEKCIYNGADIFVEIGPGKVASGLIKKIYPSARTFNVEDSKSAKSVANELYHI